LVGCCGIPLLGWGTECIWGKEAKAKTKAKAKAKAKATADPSTPLRSAQDDTLFNL
jgi:hypothetical protein